MSLLSGSNKPPLDISIDDGADITNMDSSDEEEEEYYVVESIKHVGMDKCVCIIIFYQWTPLA